MLHEDILTADEVADWLQVQPETVRRWHRQGLIPGRRLAHKVLRFNLSDVVAALEANHRAKPSTPPRSQPTDPADAGPDELITIHEARSCCSPETLNSALGFHRHRVADDGSIYWVKDELRDVLSLIAGVKGVQS